MEAYYKEAERFLKERLFLCNNIDEVEKRYRYEHSLRVAYVAKTIAEKENQNVFVATLAAILHDVGKFDTEIFDDHGRVSADVALPFLETLGIREELIKDIHYCIAKHVDDNAGYEYADIPEANTVSDADNIDRFGTYRIYQALVWDKIDTLNSSEAIEKYNNRIARTEKFRDTYKMSTETANEMFRKNLNIQIEFYKSLVEELKGSLTE